MYRKKKFQTKTIMITAFVMLFIALIILFVSKDLDISDQVFSKVTEQYNVLTVSQTLSLKENLCQDSYYL